MLRPLVAVFLAAAVCSCGRAPTDRGTELQRGETPVRTADRAPLRTAAPAVAVAPTPLPIETPRLDPDWPVTAMQHPDPRVRRFALEQWARNPTGSLELVAAAMVDPEETIRERAEQLFEEALARRR